MTATEPYRPSNGTEGELFCEDFCNRCKREQGFMVGTGDGCPILSATLIYDVDEPEYPPEWVRDVGSWPGNPRCTAFEPLEEAQ